MAKEEIKRPTPEPIKFLGQEATKTVKTDGSVITIRMNKDAHLALLEKEGITKEVIETMGKGLQKVSTDAVMAAKDLCKKNKGVQINVALGSGAFSQEFKFIGKKEFNGHNPATGEKLHRVDYGVVEGTLNLPFGKEWKGEDGLFAQVSKEMDDFFNKKK